MSNSVKTSFHRRFIPTQIATDGAVHLNARTNTRATRELFTTGQLYAGRLCSVERRPIENCSRSLALLRLEFAIYLFDESERRLGWLGKTACRDLVIVAGAALDPGVAGIVRALQVHRPENVESWLNLADKGPWVKIVFGELAAEDDRNPFRSIVPFDASGYTVPKRVQARTDRFVKPSVAADELGKSKSTVLRRVDALQAEWSSSLVRRTRGGHRQVNLSLLRHLWER